MSKPSLSICIPTHHGRSRVLDRALDSIAHQLVPGVRERVQVCVSDNGTQDDTRVVLARRRDELGSALATHRFDTDVGFTANLLRATELASGDFCWLLGSDDTIEPGGLDSVLAVLDREPDLTGLTLNRRNVDDARADVVRADDPRILPPPGRTSYSSAREVFAELAMLQDYISTQVIRRSRWQEAVRALGPEGIAQGLRFPHIPILGEAIRRAPRWYWHAEPVVRHRIGVEAVEDTFGPDLVRYTILVTADRARIWAAMFGRRSALYRAAMARAWRVQASPGALAHLKLQPRQTLRADLDLLIAMVRHYHVLPRFWVQSLPVLVLPHSAVAPLRRLALALRKG